MTSAERVAALEAQLRDLTCELADALRRVAELQSDMRALRGTVDGTGPRFAAIYPGFIDRFRGSTAQVTAKLAAYLPDVSRFVAGDGMGVVDVGCGRGEWLTLLRDAGIPAIGVDSNRTFVDAARARGLDAVHGDAVAHLQDLPEGTVDMVTAFHIIEHLDVEELLALLAAASHALRPGGCVLLETPNPTNLQMAACDFYNDPTHRSPLPPALTEYLVSASGFEDVEVRPMNPNQAPFLPTSSAAGSDVERVVASALFGPQDYAVLGFRPSAGE
jgi:SAM-dependent methyltransferase